MSLADARCGTKYRQRCFLLVAIEYLLALFEQPGDGVAAQLGARVVEHAGKQTLAWNRSCPARPPARGCHAAAFEDRGFQFAENEAFELGVRQGLVFFLGVVQNLVDRRTQPVARHGRRTIHAGQQHGQLLGGRRRELFPGSSGSRLIVRRGLPQNRDGANEFSAIRRRGAAQPRHEQDGQ